MIIPNRLQSGFALVGLLIAVVVIGILAAITYASYSGNSQQKPATVKQEAIVSNVQSDLRNASTQLELYFVDNDQYPRSLDTQNCSVSPSGSSFCLRPSKGIVFTYSSSAPYTTYSLTGTDSNNVTYRITNDSGPIKVE